MSELITSGDIGLGLQITAGQLTVNLGATSETLIVGFASGHQQNATTIIARGCAIVRTNVGRYTVNFASAHPDGATYEVLFGQQESGALRDVPKVSVVDGTKTANGFNVQVTVDDNGGGADAYTDDFWSFEALRSVSVITGITAL